MPSPTTLAQLANIDRANALIGERRRAVERQFEIRRRDATARTGDPFAFVKQIDVLARAADEAVPDDAWPEAFGALTDVADAFLGGSADDRVLLTDGFASAAALADGHAGYFVRAAAEMGRTCDAVWLRRSLALAALASGGKDYRDEQLSLDGLVAAARACGIDAAPEFRSVAALASATRPFGHGSASVREYLLGYARRQAISG
jgi:hypothetical protein